MNRYLENLNRIEFVVTTDCTGKCLHCSQGFHAFTGKCIDKDVAAKVVRQISSAYKIQSVMTFGGESLLYPESVCAVHNAAMNAGISQRQLITNGFFSEDKQKIRDVVGALSESGVNDLLLSVDAFHQKTIPTDAVKCFADEVLKSGMPMRLNPAWLVGRDADNVYNEKTRQIVQEFVLMGVRESYGNDIFPYGNAAKLLKEYFDDDKEYVNPYEEDPYNLKSVSIEPDGRILDGNVYSENVLGILERYKPSV